MSVVFTGEFEMHLTVRVAGEEALDALRIWAGARDLKFHHIILERGHTPSQPMVTRRGRGGLTDQLAAGEELCRQLSAAGFPVSRVKVEAAPGNIGVPATDADAVDHAGRYFEHHVKLALPHGADLVALAALAVTHTAHLSRNARRVRDDGRQERFVTQRCHGGGRVTARNRLDALVAALAATGHAVLSVEEEFVVHDSDPGIDAGWLEQETSS